MYKFMVKLLLVAALCLPWATQAQDCTQTVTQNQPFTEDFESVTGTTYSTAGSLPTCWNGYSNGTSAAYTPHVVGSGTYWYTHSGSKALGLTSGGTAYGNTKYVFLPPMSAALNQLELTFWMCTGSASSGTLSVGYVTADDTSTFVSVQTFPASSATVHSGSGLQATAGAEYTVSLSNVPSTATRLAFKWYYGSSYYSCFIDDVIVAYPPTCPKVENLSVTPSGSSALVTWTEAGTATSWEVTLSDSSGVLSTSLVTSTSFPIGNLTPLTAYSVSVRAICDVDDTSMARNLDFSTTCEAISSEDLPYTYGVEDASGTGAAATFNQCWNKHTNYSTAYPYPSSTNKHSGTYAFYFYSTSSYYSYMTLPPFEDDIEDLYISFWAYKTSASYGHVYVGVMSDPNNITSFDTLATLQVSPLNTWEFFEVDLSNYTGNGGLLTLLSPQMSATSYVYIDDITVSYPPACLTPTNIAGSNATANTVDVTWTSSASGYIVEYGPQGFTIGTGDSLYVNTNSVTLSGLTMGLNYAVYVTAICGSDTSNPAYGVVATGCASLSENDLPYTETFESYYSGSTNPINTCWTKGTNSSTAYPYPSTTAINGARTLYFYSTCASSATGTSYYSYAALPPIDDNLDMSDLMVTFMARRYSTTTAAYHSMILVGVADSVTGFSNAAAIDSLVTWIDTFDITAEAASSIHSAEVSFENYAGNGKYVVLYAPVQDFVSGTTQYNYIYLDDVTLRVIPNCYWPTDVVINDVSIDGAELSWTPDPRTTNPNNWIVEYGIHGFTPGEGDVEYASDTTVTLTGLTANTEYDVYVSANCGSELSDATMFSFRTLCESLDTLPLFENFDAYTSGWGNTPNCWRFLNQSSSSTTYPQAYVYSSTTYAVSGKCLYFKSSSTTPIYAIFPAIDADLNTLQVSFTYRNEGTTAANGTLSLGFMTNPSVDTTFVEVATFDRTTTLTSVEIPFSAYDYESGDYYIAFKYTGGTANNYYLGIDNVTVEPVPTCQRSINLSADSLSHDYARLTWQNYSESVSSYTVYYSTEPVFSFDTCQFMTVYDTSAELFNLDMQTNYYWTVVANCGGDSSAVPQVQSFRTLLDCGENSVNIVGTIGEGTSTGYTYFVYNYSSYPIGYTASIFGVEEMAGLGLLASADINSVSVRAASTACTVNHLQVYIGEDTISEFTGAVDTTRFGNLTLVYDGTLTTTANEWAEIVFDSAWHYSGANNLIVCFIRDTNSSASGTFYYGSTSPDYRTLYGYRTATSTSNPTATRAVQRVNMMFNLCAEVPTCVRPMDVSVDNLLDSTVTFSWEPIEGSYEYAFGPSGFAPDNANAISTLDTFAVVNGLTQNTAYDFYVRTVCAAGLVSDWSIATSILTPCSAQPLPYTEDFESYGTGSSQSISSCWVKGTNSTTAYPYPYSTNVVNGARSLYFYGYHPSTATTTSIYSYAALPLMQAPIDTLMVSFSLRRSSNTYTYYTSRILVGVMSDPTDISTFVGIDTIDLYNEAPGSIHSFEVSFDNYTGNGQYIAFYDDVPPLYGTNTYSYSYVSLDDITVDYIPNCRRITNITVDNATENSAFVYWFDPNHTPNGYEVEYGPEGFAQGTGTTVTTIDTFITVSGLTASSGYDFYVRPVCSATENGAWSFVTNFRTICGIYNVPFTEDFESYGSGSSASIDPCWTKGTSSTTAYPYPSSTAISGTRSLYFYGYQPSSATSTPIYSYVALPEFNVGVDSLELSFKMKRYTSTGSYYTSRLLVGVMTDPEDISTFVGIDTIDLHDEATGSIHDIVVDFSSYTGNGKHIAIYDAVPPLYGTGTYTYSYVYIDDISVDRMSPCGRPHSLSATATNNTITVEWVDTVGSTQWQIEYGPTGFTVGSGTVVTVNTNPYTITGLTTSTIYDVYVRSICSDGSIGGNNTGTFTVSTTQVPATLPYLYNFENAAEWNNWQMVSNNTVGWYRGTAEAAEGSYGLYVSTDSGATCNSLHTTITNAAVYRDIDFGSTPSSFEVTFLAKSAGVSDGNYEGINVMLADPTIPVAASSTALTSPWGSFNVVHVVRDTTWQEHTLLLDNISGVQRLVFNWYTSTTTTHPVWDGAGAIDSLVVIEQSCVRPLNNHITDIGSDYVSLSWDGPANANYMVRLREVDGTANIDNVANTNSITVNNLASSTHYYAWVYRICDTNNYSYSAPRIEFVTTCLPYDAVDTLREGFDSITGTAYNAAGSLPDCWEGYSNGTSDNYFPHVTNGSTYSYSVSGNAVTLTSGSSSTYGNTKILRLPKFTEPINTMTMSYWYCTESSTIGTLYVGYMTGFDYENDFVPLVTHPASSESMHSGNGEQTAGHGVFDTISFDSVPSNALFIAFKWYQDGTYYSVCIDDVEVASNGNYCRAPVANISDVTYNSATLNWSSSSELFEVAVKASTEAVWPAETAVNNATNYAFTGLQPSTIYLYRVRAICDTAENMISEWTEGAFVTDSLPCFAPTNLQNTAVDLTTATFDWTAGGDETAWRIYVWNSTFSQSYDVTSHPATVTGLSQTTDYYATVVSVCGGILESESSDTVQFTTATCQPVSNVAVSNIGQTTATVSWSGDAASYTIEYGMGDFEQGNGTSVSNITATTYTIEGLTADRNYSVYVRANCDANNPSAWSDRVQFRTEAVGIADVDGVSVSIYPNPTTDNTTIALSGVSGDVTITIVDLSGRTVKTDSMSCDGDCVKTVEVSGLAEGAYFVRISGENVNMVKKLVVK